MDIKQAANAYNTIAGIAQNTPSLNNVSQSSPTDASFLDMISDALSGALDSGHKAESVSTLALMGKTDITNLAVAVSNAELALDTVVTIRDKMISAYQQISQMPM